MNVDGKRVKLQIWDTAGQEKFRAIVQSYYRGVRGVLAMYDTTDLKSFENLAFWLEEVRQNATCDKLPIILVGTKTDLIEHRAVTFEKVQKFAQGKPVTSVFETSAKNGTNVDEVFEEMARQLKASCLSDEHKIYFDSDDGAVRLEGFGYIGYKKKCNC